MPGSMGTFLHQGQICVGINKTLVRETIYDEYVRRFTQRVKDHPAGDPHDEKTIVGPIINQEQMDRILGFIRDTVKLGEKTETGGGYNDLFIEPTVLSEV